MIYLRVSAFRSGLDLNFEAMTYGLAYACTYVLIAIAKRRLHLPNSLHEILQMLSLTMFKTTPINQLLKNTKSTMVQNSRLNSSLYSENRWDTTAVT